MAGSRNQLYAERTDVPPERSREEIRDLLRRWGCEGLRWTEMPAKIALEFLLRRPGSEGPHLVRITAARPSTEELRRLVVTNSITKARRDKLLAKWEWIAHRQLLCWMRAQFVAIEGGLMSTEQALLPYFVGADGRTFADHALPRLPKLLTGGAKLLLPPGADDDEDDGQA